MTDVEISDVTADSRKAGEGTLYAAVRGRSQNGNDFISDAVRHGASAVVTDSAESIKAGVPVIYVPDAKTALSRLCARVYAKGADMRVFAVTGTNGKTTTSVVLSHILAAAGFRTAVIGTVGVGFCGETVAGDGMTTPIPEVLYSELGRLAREGAECAVIEVSSHGIAEGRLSGLRETKCELCSALFTNLSPEHLDYHADMDDYFRVKSRLFTDFGFRSAVINVNDGYGRKLASSVRCNTVTVGDGADYAATDVTYGSDGVRYTLMSEYMRLAVRCPFAGAYTVENTLLAASAAIEFGIDPLTVSEALGTFRGVRGRMERLPTEGFCAPVYIDFAHTPEALRALLSSVRRMHPDGRIVLLFGCGGDRDKTKRPVMGRIASVMADHTVITSDNSRTEDPDAIISDILAGVTEDSSYSVIRDRKNAIEYTLVTARDGDVILLAGKGHEDYEDRNGEKTHFDEREIVREVINKLNGS